MPVTERGRRIGTGESERAKMADEKIAFATVGSTSFDRLVETLTSKPITKLLQRLGYTKLLIQIGRGAFEPDAYETKAFSLEIYRYKNSLKEDMSKASLVISHAGNLIKIREKLTAFPRT